MVKDVLHNQSTPSRLKVFIPFCEMSFVGLGNVDSDMINSGCLLSQNWQNTSKGIGDMLLETELKRYALHIKP
jgi:hypothetical protein